MLQVKGKRNTRPRAFGGKCTRRAVKGGPGEPPLPATANRCGRLCGRRMGEIRRLRFSIEKRVPLYQLKITPTAGPLKLSDCNGEPDLKS